jgi:hypothetical protein
MANHWLMHVKKTMKTMKSNGSYKKGDGLKKVIKAAKKTYKKHKGGSETQMDSSESAMGGRRRRRRTARR